MSDESCRRMPCLECHRICHIEYHIDCETMCHVERQNSCHIECQNYVSEISCQNMSGLSKCMSDRMLEKWSEYLTWLYPKMGVPLTPPFLIGLFLINHPFGGNPMTMETPDICQLVGITRR